MSSGNFFLFDTSAGKVCYSLNEDNGLVTFTALPLVTIYYTTDGSTPTFPVAGTTQTYSAPFAISPGQTVRYFGRDDVANTTALRQFTLPFPPDNPEIPVIQSPEQIQLFNGNLTNCPNRPKDTLLTKALLADPSEKVANSIADAVEGTQKFLGGWFRISVSILGLSPLVSRPKFR